MDEHEVVRYQAVFKGGGAKGVAYAGALRACEEAGIEFGAAAGSSAGAITAMLVACRFTADEIAARMPDALATMSDPALSVLRLGRASLMSSSRLRRWLADTLDEGVRRAGAPPSSSVSFSELRRATQCDLYVVAMDLGTRQPIVFGPELTPDVPVADAVVASSAIPVAFPPVRLQIGDEIHRVVDGGTWANYPAFVFLDADFRRHHGLPEGTSPTIGFVLDEPDTVEVGHRSVDTAAGPRFWTDRGSAVRELGMLGAVLSSPVARWTAALAPLLLVAISWFAVWKEIDDGFPVVATLPDGIETVALLLAASLLSVAGLASVLISLVVVRFGKELGDTGMVGAMAAMGVGPSVPYWFGGDAVDARHLVVRIPVPNELSTLAFRAPPAVVDAAVAAGHTATAGALARSQRVGPPRPSFPPSSWSAPPGAVGTVPSPLSRPLILIRRLLAGLGWLIRRSFVIRVVTVSGAVIGGAALVGLGVALLVEGRIAFAPLVLVPAALLFLSAVGLLGGRKAGLGAEAYPVLRRRSLPALLLMGAFAVFAGSSLAWALSVGGSVVVVHNSASTLGMIVSTTDRHARVVFPETVAEHDVLTDGGGRPPPTVDVPVVEGADFDRLAVDATGRPLARCRIDADDLPDGVATDRCLVLPIATGATHPDGSVLAVRFDPDRGAAFLPETASAVEMYAFSAYILIFAGLLVGLAFHCSQVWVWRRSQRSLRAAGDAVAPPWPAPTMPPTA